MNIIRNLSIENNLTKDIITKLVIRAKQELNVVVSTAHVVGVITYLTNENIVDLLSLETLVNECECPKRKAQRILQVISKVNQYIELGINKVL